MVAVSPVWVLAICSFTVSMWVYSVFFVSWTSISAVVIVGVCEKASLDFVFCCLLGVDSRFRWYSQIKCVLISYSHVVLVVVWVFCSVVVDFLLFVVMCRLKVNLHGVCSNATSFLNWCEHIVECFIQLYFTYLQHSFTNHHFLLFCLNESFGRLKSCGLMFSEN